MFGWMLMGAAMAHPPVDFVACAGDESVWVASLDDGAWVDRTSQTFDEADVAAVWSGGRVVPIGVDRATVAWSGCAEGPRRPLELAAPGAVDAREARAQLTAVPEEAFDVAVQHPVGGLPVVEVVARVEGGGSWTVVDGAGEVVFAAAVTGPPTWQVVSAGEPGRFVGWAPTSDGLALVQLGDGAITVWEAPWPAERPGAGAELVAAGSVP